MGSNETFRIEWHGSSSLRSNITLGPGTRHLESYSIIVAASILLTVCFFLLIYFFFAKAIIVNVRNNIHMTGLGSCEKKNQSQNGTNKSHSVSEIAAFRHRHPYLLGAKKKSSPRRHDLWQLSWIRPISALSHLSRWRRPWCSVLMTSHDARCAPRCAFLRLKKSMTHVRDTLLTWVTFIAPLAI